MIQLEEIKLSYLPNRRSKLDITEEPWLAKGMQILYLHIKA